MTKTALDVKDVQRLLGRKQGYAYKIIRDLNEELRGMGFYTTPGRVSAKYFFERMKMDPVTIEADEA